MYMKQIILELQKWNQMKNEPCSCERSLCNYVINVKKIQDLNGIWTHDLAT